MASGDLQHLLDDGMAAFGDFEHVAFVERRPAVIPFAREQRPAGEHIELGERVGGLGERDGFIEHGGDELR